MHKKSLFFKTFIEFFHHFTQKKTHSSLWGAGLRTGGESFKIIGQGTALIAAVFIGDTLFHSAARGISAIPGIITGKHSLSGVDGAANHSGGGRDAEGKQQQPGQPDLCQTCGRYADGEEPVSWTSVGKTGVKLLKCAAFLGAGAGLKMLGTWMGSKQVVNSVVAATHVSV